MQIHSKSSGLVPPTTTRLPGHTPNHLNQRIQSRGLENVVTYAEISTEYYSLRLLRGDFRELSHLGGSTPREKE